MKIAKLAIALGLCAAGFSASAQVQNATMNVTANVPGVCTLTAGAMSFGQYDSTLGTDFTAVVQFNCTTGASSSITMNYSGNATGAQRRMVNGGSYLNYAVYQPVSATPGAACAYTNAWGNVTTGGTALVTGTGAVGTSRNYNVCGRIAAGQTGAPVGNYADTVAIVATL